MAFEDYHSEDAIVDFALRYAEDLNRIIGARMRQLGVPEHMVGIRDYPGVDQGAFTRFPNTQIGGNVNPAVSGRTRGIALDHGVLDPDHPYMADVLSWKRSRLKDRIDAAIVHEYVEAMLVPPAGMTGSRAADWLHREAIRRAPETNCPITETARSILHEYRQAMGLENAVGDK